MTDKLDDAALAAIRARHEQDERWRNSPSMVCPQSHDDRAALIAEVERLREDLDRVTRGTWSKELARLSAVNADLRDENDAFRKMQP